MNQGIHVNQARYSEGIGIDLQDFPLVDIVLLSGTSFLIPAALIKRGGRYPFDAARMKT